MANSCPIKYRTISERLNNFFSFLKKNLSRNESLKRIPKISQEEIKEFEEWCRLQ